MLSRRIALVLLDHLCYYSRVNAPLSGAQSNIPSKLLRPLPRRRVERFAWQWPDTIWIAAIVVACVALTPRGERHGRELIGLAMCIICAAAAYLAGLKMHSRVAGVTAAVLMATSRGFVLVCVDHPSTGAVACAVMVAVASYGVGWLVAVYVAACVAFTLGFNGALIGLVIALVPVLQKRGNAIAGLMGYIAFGALWSVAIRHAHIPTALRPWRTWHEARNMIGLAVMILWFMAPFYAEATLKGAREKWLLALALVATVTFVIFTSTTAITPQLYQAFPLAMLVVAVGLARLMPVIAGEYPSTIKRYAAATAAVALTIGLKLCLDPTPTTMPMPATLATAPPRVAIPAVHSAPGSINKILNAAINKIH